jgi:hypothetical protein
VALGFVVRGVLLVVALVSISALGSPAWAQDDDLNCEDFPSQAAAQREYEKNPQNDPNNLDADNDGQACEDFDYSGSGARGAADNQYRRDEVIVETIPKRKLADTSGPPLILLAGAALLLSTGLVLGRSVIRRTP